MSSSTKIVVTDANVLINLIHTDRLESFAALPEYEFVIPEHVQQELSDPTHKARIEQAIKQKLFVVASITDPNDIGLFASLITNIGRGEAACIVIVKKNGWLLASDEKRRFQRDAEAHLGLNRQKQRRLPSSVEMM